MIQQQYGHRQIAAGACKQKRRHSSVFTVVQIGVHAIVQRFFHRIIKIVPYQQMKLIYNICSGDGRGMSGGSGTERMYIALRRTEGRYGF